MIASSSRRERAALGDFEGEISEVKACAHAIRALTDRSGGMNSDDKDAVFFFATLVSERCDVMERAIDREVA